jgi:hypothetical protein
MKQNIPVNDDERVANPERPKSEAQEIIEQILELQRQIRVLERKLQHVENH